MARSAKEREIARAVHQRLKHRAAGDAEHVAGDRQQLDASVLEYLVQALRLAGPLLDLRLAVAGEIAQVADRLGRHEGTVLEQSSSST